MAKKSAILRGLPAVQAANLLDGIIYGAVKMAHLENPSRTMRDIAECALTNFGIEGVPAATILRTYYRMEGLFLGKGYAEDDTENATQSTDQ